MIELKNKYNQKLLDLFKFILNENKLSIIEIEQIYKGTYFNLNTLKGNKNMQCLFPDCENIGVEKSHLFAESLINFFSKNGKFFTKKFYPNVDLNNLNFRYEEIGVINKSII